MHLIIIVGVSLLLGIECFIVKDLKWKYASIYINL